MSIFIDAIRSWKPLALALGLTISAPLFASAQDAGSPPPHARAFGRRARGGCTEEQGPGFGNPNRGRHLGMRRGMRGEMNANLTPEQRDQLRAQRLAARLEHMTQRFHLNAQQRASVQRIFQRAQLERARIAQATQPRSEERRSAMSALRQRTRQALTSIVPLQRGRGRFMR